MTTMSMSTYTIPNVTQRTPTGERSMDLYSRLLAERIVYLSTPIDHGVANSLIGQLIHLESEHATRPIDFYISSPGGSIGATLGVYDAMTYIAPPVHTVCVGEAGATAALLLAAGQPGARRMMPNARVTLHQPGTQGRRAAIPDLIVEAEELARVRSVLEEILAQHTGRDVAQVREDTERDLVLGAEEAVEYGLVDAVLQSRKRSVDDANT
ncbi:ClpP family protease [Euzebya tangerina]|uniref:ClpP family protease n=1 Tax=Euzebya tangerina TaxID=591198 RepID=UPI00196A7FA3|nr:ATP-dependent Clp protease proteolytic subunit [Euzebya tangerina]